MTRFYRHALALAALCAAALLDAGCNQDMSLVGGACAEGLTECSLRCVDLNTDPANCGSCGNACSAGVACVDGTCGGRVDGADASIDSTRDDGGSQVDTGSDTGDGAKDDAAGEASADAGDTGTADGSSDASPDQDATGDVADAGRTDAVGEGCAPPLLRCDGACLDVASDPWNCGACGKFCPSNLCSSGACQGSTPGDVVVIGHDYATTPPGTAQANVLANAAFIATTNPLRVMSYERYADPSAVSHAKAILAARAAPANRAIAYTIPQVDGDVPGKLVATAFDVLLVYDQKNAPPGALAAIGASWASATTAFTKGGGLVIVLDGADGTGEMPRFVSSASLLDVRTHAPLAAGAAVTVTQSSDVVGVGVLSPYGVWDRSATFTLGSLVNVTLVVRGGAGSGDPVVAHRVVP